MLTIIRHRHSLRFSKILGNLLFTSSKTSSQNSSQVLTLVRNTRFKHSYIPRYQDSAKGTKYAPPSSIEIAEESISHTLKDKTYLSIEEWDDFKSNLFDHDAVVSEENFSSIVMNTLLVSNQVDLSHSFLEYVESSNVKPNFLTYLKYISLCSRNLKIVNQDRILKVIEKVKSQIDANPVLDNKRAEYIIEGFCATERWRESFQYLKKLVSGKPSRTMCNALACAAIRNGDENLAWEILTKWINPYETVSDRIVEEFLLVALKIKKGNCWDSDKLVEKLFEYMKVRDVVISIDVAKLIEQYFSSHRIKWNITYTKVSRRAVCENCYDNLPLLQLKNQDYDNLREAFLEKAVMKSDIYINTTAKEFQKYMEFIDVHKPFHVVCDGLNAAHSFQGFFSKKNLSIHLWNIVKKLSRKNRNILVLGRKHMKGWPNICRISEKAQLFFTDNISQDDPFLIYATLASGPHTVFLSADLMRDHMSRLEDPRLIHLFKRWQLSHQVYLKSDEYNKITFVEPVRHSITIHGSMEDGWHIPFDDKIILDPYEELNNWLCIKACV